MRWAGHVARRGEEYVQGFGGKARRKETRENSDYWKKTKWVLTLLRPKLV
jgi:hypothetical protein